MVERKWDNSFKARLLCKTYLFWHAVSLLNFVLIEEQHAHCGLPRGFWWFSGPGEGLRVVLRVCPGLGGPGLLGVGCAIYRCSTAGFGPGYEATEVPSSDRYRFC